MPEIPKWIGTHINVCMFMCATRRTTVPYHRQRIHSTETANIMNSIQIEEFLVRYSGRRVDFEYKQNTNSFMSYCCIHCVCWKLGSNFYLLHWYSCWGMCCLCASECDNDVIICTEQSQHTLNWILMVFGRFVVTKLFITIF